MPPSPSRTARTVQAGVWPPWTACTWPGARKGPGQMHLLRTAEAGLRERGADVIQYSSPASGPVTPCIAVWGPAIRKASGTRSCADGRGQQYRGPAGAAVTFAGTAVGTWSAVSRQEEQRKQAEFAADMARRNAQMAEENARMAEEEAGQARADSYDAAVRKRQETALLIGRQRAQAGASGAQIDSGSHLDSQLDLREKGSWMPCPSRNRGSAPPQSGGPGLEPAQRRPGSQAGNASCAAKAARTTFPGQDPAQRRRTPGQQL